MSPRRRPAAGGKSLKQVGAENDVLAHVLMRGRIDLPALRSLGERMPTAPNHLAELSGTAGSPTRSAHESDRVPRRSVSFLFLLA